jgi:hypothetical protein
MISKFARWAGVASEGRHDHARGTLITRPSTRYAVIASIAILMSRILGSLLTTVLMPCLQNEILVLFNHPPNPAQFPRRETVISSKLDRIQPELAGLPFTPDVDVTGFITIETVKEKPVRTRNAPYPRHSTPPADEGLRYSTFYHGLAFSRPPNYLFECEELRIGKRQTEPTTVFFPG